MVIVRSKRNFKKRVQFAFGPMPIRELDQSKCDLICQFFSRWILVLFDTPKDWGKPITETCERNVAHQIVCKLLTYSAFN